jgi:hypothetical protein
VIFLSPSRRMSGLCLKIRLRQLPSRSFSIHHSRITLSFIAALVTEEASLNKLQINKIKKHELFQNDLIVRIPSSDHFEQQAA